MRNTGKRKKINNMEMMETQQENLLLFSLAYLKGSHCWSMGLRGMAKKGGGGGPKSIHYIFVTSKKIGRGYLVISFS